MSDVKKTVLSCIQPTGDMHLGNYFGAVKNWVDLQEKYECVFGVVDYHAMTMPYDVKKLRNNTWELITNLIAVGVNPENLFIQSLVPEHAELGWIFNCFCGVGELSRMTQFKDKSQKNEEGKNNFISVGLLDYPVLQTADILIYKADFVPVGKDQEQHLELSRNIAGRFNHQVGQEYFVMPQGLYTETPKIMSTADPTRKMSKSAGENHYISLFSEPTRITKQIKSAVTDTGGFQENMSEGVTNLFRLLKASGDTDNHAQLMSAYNDGNLRYGDLKGIVAESLVTMTSAFAVNKKEILVNRKDMKNQIKQSSYEIRKKAQNTLKEVKELVGLMNVRF
ncbi:MAG: tryptophan--tRNA ligase [Saprospiraceae bacterium]